MIKDDLFELIKTMTAAEKRLFKLKASTYKKDDKSSLLFDVYASSSSLGIVEKELSRKIVSKRLGKLHSELYQQLQVFFAEEEIKSGKKFQLFQKILTARSFLKRKLFRQSDQIIQKVIKEALHYEMYEIVLEALGVKQMLSNHTSKNKGSNQDRIEVINEWEFIIDKIHAVHTRFIGYNKLLHEHRIKGSARNKEEINYYQNLVQHINLEEGEGLRIRRNNILIKSILRILVQTGESSTDLKRSLIKLYDEYEHLARLNPRDLAISHYNLANELIRENEMEEASVILYKLNNIINEEKETAFLKPYSKSLSLAYFVRLSNKEKSLKLANELAPSVHKEGDATYINFYSVKIIVAYLLSAKYDLALDFINSILNNQIKDSRKDCYSLLLFYEIIIYIKLDWHSMAESKLLGLVRYLKLHYNKSSFENWSISFLRKLIKAKGKGEKIIMEKAFQNIDKIKDDELSVGILGVGEFEVWLRNEMEK